MASKSVSLSQKYAGASGAFDVVEFRAPRWDDFVDLGDVEEYQPTGKRDPETGIEHMMLMRHHDVVAAYAERCLKEPRTAGDLALLELDDVVAVHRTIRDFFVQARSSKTRPTDSSGGSEKGSTKSGD